MNRLVTPSSMFWVKSDVIEGKTVWGIADDEGGFQWTELGTKAAAQALLAAMAAEEEDVLFSD